MATTVTSMHMGTNKKTAITFGIVLILVGLLAYITNPLVGPAGFFLTNRSHDLIHVLSGVIFLVAGYAGEVAALRTIQTFGVIYAIIAIAGLFVGTGMLFGFIEINVWDNLLHIVIALIALYLGYAVLNRKM